MGVGMDVDVNETCAHLLTNLHKLTECDSQCCTSKLS